MTALFSTNFVRTRPHRSAISRNFPMRENSDSYRNELVRPSSGPHIPAAARGDQR